MHKYLTPWFIAAYATGVIGGAALLAGCSRDAGAGSAAVANEPMKVVVAPIRKSTRALPIRTSGRLSAKAEIKLSFKIGGLVERFFADEGARVRSGALMARLNLSEIDAQVLQAQSALEKARRDLERIEGLYKDSVATLEQLQDTRTGAEMAEAALQIAVFNRKHAEITAPATGRILKRAAEAGELVAAGQPIFLFSADEEGWVVRVGLSDRDIVKLAVGDSASLIFDAYPGQAFNGWVAEVADAADPLSGTFEVEVAVKDPGRLLKSGFVARVDLYPAQAESVMLAPIEALVEGNGREGVVFVYDAATGQAKKVPVQIARILDAELAITGGLEDYDQVITEGAGFLKGDQPVQVMPR